MQRMVDQKNKKRFTRYDLSQRFAIERQIQAYCIEIKEKIIIIRIGAGDKMLVDRRLRADVQQVGLHTQLLQTVTNAVDKSR